MLFKNIQCTRKNGNFGNFYVIRKYMNLLTFFNPKIGWQPKIKIFYVCQYTHPVSDETCKILAIFKPWGQKEYNLEFYRSASQSHVFFLSRNFAVTLHTFWIFLGQFAWFSTFLGQFWSILGQFWTFSNCIYQ